MDTPNKNEIDFPRFSMTVNHCADNKEFCISLLIYTPDCCHEPYCQY